jgi:hypothetical protein
MSDTYTLQRESTFIRNKLILSSEKILHMDYVCKGSVAKKNPLVVGAWQQDELIGGKPPVVK